MTPGRPFVNNIDIDGASLNKLAPQNYLFIFYLSKANRVENLDAPPFDEKNEKRRAFFVEIKEICLLLKKKVVIIVSDEKNDVARF